MWVKQTLGEQRKLLSALLEPSMQEIAKCCISTWHETEALDAMLMTQFSDVPHIQLLYALDKLGHQISANVSANGLDGSYRGQDLSRRPYSVSLYPKRHFMLSSVYISQTTGNPSISAVQPVINEQQFLGFIVADFDIRYLPVHFNPPRVFEPWPKQAMQIPLGHRSEGKAMPIKTTRAFNLIDQHLTQITHTIEQLMLARGVFHVTLNYTTNLLMLWETHDPYQYHLLTVEQVLYHSNVVNEYRLAAYPEQAKVTPSQLGDILKRFSILRLAEGKEYLCSASINVMNGMVGLSFSCDNSQYMSAAVFLERNLSDWIGRRVAVNEN